MILRLIANTLQYNVSSGLATGVPCKNKHYGRGLERIEFRNEEGNKVPSVIVSRQTTPVEKNLGNLSPKFVFMNIN